MENYAYIKREIFEIKNDPLFLESLSNLQIDLTNLELFTQYYSAYYENDFEDLSFAVSYENTMVAFVFCYNINKKLCMPAGGIEIVLKEVNHNKKLTDFIVNAINQIAYEHKCEEIFIRDELTSNKLSYLAEKLLLDRYSCKTTFNMKIPFCDFSEASFSTSIRKSYKSLINWGKKNLTNITLSSDNLNENLFNVFKEFHHHISGRKTRSDLTWEIQYEMIKKGYAELDLAYLENELVAGSFFSDFAYQSIYFTGVYNRNLFHKGISHYLLYKGILQAHRRRKTHFFSLGDFDSGITDDKWFNIQFFKKGFCKELTPNIIWNNII